MKFVITEDELEQEYTTQKLRKFCKSGKKKSFLHIKVGDLNHKILPTERDMIQINQMVIDAIANDNFIITTPCWVEIKKISL